MSNFNLIIEERARQIGHFLVGRLLPFRKKRMVGPFIFIDHMGPSQLGPEKYLDVDQHPHIGLSTLTYLLEGEMMHRDSIGSVQRITPGSVNWMVAGNGVAHTERTPGDLRQGKVSGIHGYQIWVALPKELEDMEPEFHHLSKEEIPTWTEGNAEFKLVAGEGFGRKSPLPVHSPIFMLDVRSTGRQSFDASGQLFGEIGIVVVKGGIQACGEQVSAGNMLVSTAEGECEILIEADSQVLVFGGEPFPEKRFIRWNFVSTDPEKIADQKQRWINREFPKVPGDDTYVAWP